MVRRSRLEIYFDVLDVNDKGTAKPTRIMYETNLSWTSLCNVFETLINSDFIREQKRKNKILEKPNNYSSTSS